MLSGDMGPGLQAVSVPGGGSAGGGLGQTVLGHLQVQVCEGVMVVVVVLKVLISAVVERLGGWLWSMHIPTSPE
uniref:Uncharacterized protein n=1 Tax=Hucho hucho TaxID=62062 RepID=A0A4W5RHG1_9TELE